MTSTRPYLIRAFYDWIVDNACTPHIVVNATLPGVDVPKEYVDGGQIVLNISLSAVNGLTLGDHAIEFQARFGGDIRQVYAPVVSVMAIYAKENGRGMVFAEEDADLSLPSTEAEGEGLEDGREEETEGKREKKEIRGVKDRTGKEGDKGGSGSGNGSGKPGGKTGGKPHLKIVK